MAFEEVIYAHSAAHTFTEAGVLWSSMTFFGSSDDLYPDMNFRDADIV
jgi:hypothetical protein